MSPIAFVKRNNFFMTFHLNVFSYLKIARIKIELEIFSHHSANPISTLRFSLYIANTYFASLKNFLLFRSNEFSVMKIMIMDLEGIMKWQKYAFSLVAKVNIFHFWSVFRSRQTNLRLTRNIGVKWFSRFRCDRTHSSLLRLNSTKRTGDDWCFYSLRFSPSPLDDRDSRERECTRQIDERKTQRWSEALEWMAFKWAATVCFLCNPQISSWIAGSHTLLAIT